MNRQTLAASWRMTAFAILCTAGLAGCSTTATSTYGQDDSITGSTARQELGVDHHGERIGAAWPSIPHSNQISLKGDQSRRELQLGQENFHNANYGAAEMHFRRAVEMRPDSAGAWAGLAASYDQLGRFDLADRAYTQLGKLRKNDARVANNHGYSYLLRGDYKNAEIYLKKAQQLDPLLEEATGNLQLLNEVANS